MDRIRTQLKELLNDPSNSVVVLTGSWGTGKTYLWQTVDQELKQIPVAGRHSPTAEYRSSLYISLFGLKNLQELKLQAVQAAAINEDNRLKDTLKSGINLVKQIWKSVHWSGGVLDELAVMALPKIVEKRLVVLDDVERKHKTFDVEELLGFINRCAELYQARFLLILNLDQLEDKQEWETFREKVIQSELVLKPTPEEAFQIAQKLVSAPHPELLGQYIGMVGLNNIRVIHRVLRVAQRILKLFPPLPAAVLRHIFPSIVLFSTSYFKGVSSGPTIEFIRSHNVVTFDEKDNKLGPQELKWAQLIQDMGIVMLDDFEEALYSYLQTGLLDEARIKAVVSTYVESEEQEAIRARLRQFSTDAYWNINKSDAQMLGELRTLLNDVEKYDAVTVTSLSETARKLGDAALGEEFVRRSIAALRKWAETNDIGQDPGPSPILRVIHPDILAAQEELRDKRYPLPSISDVLKTMHRDRGWGGRETATLRSVTPAQYVEALRTLTSDDLAYFIREHLKWMHSGHTPSPEFVHAIGRFIEASRQIVGDAAQPKLASILRREFERAGLLNRLMETVAKDPEPARPLPSQGTSETQQT